TPPGGCGWPATPVRGGDHGRDLISGQALLRRITPDRELSESVETDRCRHPDVSFTIFEEAADDVTGQAIRFGKGVRPPTLNMDQPSLLCTDPERALTVSEQLVRIDNVVLQQRGRCDGAANGIHV